MSYFNEGYSVTVVQEIKHTHHENQIHTQPRLTSHNHNLCELFGDFLSK